MNFLQSIKNGHNLRSHSWGHWSHNPECDSSDGIGPISFTPLSGGTGAVGVTEVSAAETLVRNLLASLKWNIWWELVTGVVRFSNGLKLLPQQKTLAIAFSLVWNEIRMNVSIHVQVSEKIRFENETHWQCLHCGCAPIKLRQRCPLLC